MRFITLLGACLAPTIALGNVVPDAVPGSEIAAGGATNLLVRRGCTSNNCARAVAGTGAKPASAVRREDCSSFMRRSVVFPTTTVNPGNQRRQETVVASNIPAYASACDHVLKYSSACSCWGITATTVTVRPTVTATATTISGRLQVSVEGVSLGYVASDPNYWTPLLTPDINSALVISFKAPTGATSILGVEFAATGLQGGHPFFGFVEGRDSTSPTLQPGSFNYLYLDPVEHTPPGSTPQLVPSYFATSTGLEKTGESSVWNVDITTGVVTSTWINPDGNSASNFQIFVQSNHVYGSSDPAAFQARFPAPVTVVSLKFIPI